MSITDINIYHWLIAIGGALIHIILKLSELPETKGIWASFSRKDKFVSLASLIAIPVLLMIMTDTNLGDLFPLNNATAFLVGFQTQSIIRSFATIAGKKYVKTPD
jgi:hypothetical protein